MHLSLKQMMEVMVIITVYHIIEYLVEIAELSLKY
jgi:hypothetical protein